MDGVQEFFIQPTTKGKELLEMVAKAIDLDEIWYFGFQFTDSKGITKWLNLEKKVLARVAKNQSSLQLKLRVRFYPEDTERELIQDVTRRLFFLQGRGCDQVPEDRTNAGHVWCYLLQDEGQEETELWLGVHAFGIKIYPKDNKLTPLSQFLWDEIRRVSYDSKKLNITTMGKRVPILQVYPEEGSHKCKSILELAMGYHLYCRRKEPDSIEVQ
ncbi:ezrin-like [Poecilia latipinna]|nr:PREDICTED: ezrin-like [Poecilia mexicana]XP_014895392.1 PREDICTED: ezrin-like [Poecilia latipinna]